MGLRKIAKNKNFQIVVGIIGGALIFIFFLAMLIFVVPERISPRERCLKECKVSYKEHTIIKAYEICTEGCKTLKE